MIVAIAHADVEEARVHHLMKAWSDLVVGDKPAGLVECLLLQGDNGWQVTSIWHDTESLERAHSEEGAHPAYTVFEAAGAEPIHTTLQLTGRYHAH